MILSYIYLPSLVVIVVVAGYSEMACGCALISVCGFAYVNCSVSRYLLDAKDKISASKEGMQLTASYYLAAQRVVPGVRLFMLHDVLVLHEACRCSSVCYLHLRAHRWRNQLPTATDQKHVSVYRFRLLLFALCCWLVLFVWTQTYTYKHHFLQVRVRCTIN